MPFAEVVGPLGGGVFLKGAHHWGWASGIHSLPALPVCCLYFLRMTGDVSSQLLLWLPVAMRPQPLWTSSLWNHSQNKKVAF